jgi:hypothetical protein
MARLKQERSTLHAIEMHSHRCLRSHAALEGQLQILLMAESKSCDSLNESRVPGNAIRSTSFVSSETVLAEYKEGFAL